ncbi:MAG TPA: pyruvate, phosphate dikinase, partial [Rubrivivax sp.]|nr:pyruvate, phosphate dikinase [Rubrivivax sp.]
RCEIMVPLVGTVREFDAQAAVIRGVAAQVFAERGAALPYLLGTMIETPRAVLVADSIARQAEFFSFGTNDLTQMTLGFSRDDAGRFLPGYLKQGIYEHDPFRSIDAKGVGQLVHMAVQKGRAARAQIELGVCGEHGGDPASVAFFHRAGLDYVSCSPFRVPIARLAAAQAALAP